MTEQEIATYAETYINSVTSLARSVNWCYFIAGIVFGIIIYEVITFISNSVNKSGKDKKEKEKDKEKLKKEEVEK